ncbi:hypothetical protein STEG23_024693, partial [Scotinomys teguina]
MPLWEIFLIQITKVDVIIFQLRTKPRTLHLLGKSSTTEINPKYLGLISVKPMERKPIVVKILIFESLGILHCAHRAESTQPSLLIDEHHEFHLHAQLFQLQVLCPQGSAHCCDNNRECVYQAISSRSVNAAV